MPSLATLLEAVGGLDGRARSVYQQIEVGSVTLDHRSVAPGSLFGCLVGRNVDGHDLADAAVRAGAVAILAERPVDVEVPVVMVPSVREAVGPIAARILDYPSTEMICTGITGTNGKTTTTYLLDSIAHTAGAPSAVLGTTGLLLNGEVIPTGFTTPQAPELQLLLARCRDAGVQRLAMEVSSHALHQHRVDGSRFVAVGFSNLTHDHLDYHGDVDSYFEAKRRLFTNSFAQRAVINLDDPRGAELAAYAQSHHLEVWGITSRGASGEAVDHLVAGVNFTLDHRGISGQAEVNGTAHQLNSNLVGRFNVDNALLAFGLALATDFTAEIALAGLREPRQVPGRMESVGAVDRTVLVDYAHTPDALERVLLAARELGSRVLVVFGCGGDRDAEKRPRMGEAAARLADFQFVTNDNPRTESPNAIADAILAGMAGAAVTVELDRALAIEAAIAASLPGDVVVIAGQGHETTQTFGDQVMAFDDREVARSVLQRQGLYP